MAVLAIWYLLGREHCCRGACIGLLCSACICVLSFVGCVVGSRLSEVDCQANVGMCTERTELPRVTSRLGW